MKNKLNLREVKIPGELIFPAVFLFLFIIGMLLFTKCSSDWDNKQYDKCMEILNDKNKCYDDWILKKDLRNN